MIGTKIRNLALEFLCQISPFFEAVASSYQRAKILWNIRTCSVSGTTIKTTKKCPIKSWGKWKVELNWFRLGSSICFGSRPLLALSPPASISVFYVLRKNEAESNFSLLHTYPTYVPRDFQEFWLHFFSSYFEYNLNMGVKILLYS